ncbi:MAG: histidine phosphatase family protein [Candidatus Woesebacteria bacterium]|nr:MAG: histidine phosphatase family protein [Candidatus Woesebacteria bacterium]
MTTFYIFRHGNTIDSDSLLTKFFGHKHDSHDLVILPKALPALKKIGAFLEKVDTDANFSSPYLRCRQSTQIVSHIANKKYTVDERLREYEKNGEKFSSLRKRVRSFLDYVAKKNYSSISICTHGGIIAAIKHLATGGNFYFFQLWDFPAPGNLIVMKDGEVKTINFNK